MKIKGVIFDCDGVLVDSEVLFLAAVKEYLGSLGIRKEIKDLQLLVGQTDEKIVRDIKRLYLGSQPITAENINVGLEKLYDKLYSVNKLKPMAGLTDFVNWCREEHLRLAVASSSKRDYVCGLLAQFGISGKIEAVLSGDDVHNGKPDPEIYLKTAETMHLSHDELVVIEDSYNGIKAAKAAHIHTIGFKGSVISQDTSEADEIANNFQDVIELLKRRHGDDVDEGSIWDRQAGDRHDASDGDADRSEV